MPRPGLLGMLGTVALGALVLVADIGEVMCSFGDRVAFATPLGAPPCIFASLFRLWFWIRVCLDGPAHIRPAPLY